MSRIGKMPIAIPAGVTVDVAENNVVTVKGPKGELTRKLAPEMTIEIENNEIIVTRPNDLKRERALHGLTRTLLKNMVQGVHESYKKTLQINGTGYHAQKSGKTLTLFLGYSHPIELTDPEGVESACPNQTTIEITGIDKEKVGQYAADIRAKRPPEPYKGKGVKYSTEKIRRKAGKTGKK